MRMVIWGGSCDPALPLLALGLHLLLWSGPSSGCPGAEIWVRATRPIHIYSCLTQSSLSQPKGVPMAGVTPCSCSISHSPPACTAARWAGSLGCVGGELLHCGSWDLARGRVLVPAAEIPTWPGVQQGELGSQGRWQEQGLKAAEQSPLCSRHQERPPQAPHQTEFC